MIHLRDWSYPTAFTQWGDEERAAIYRVLNSGRFTMGDEVRMFERDLAAYHGVKHAIMVNSGSSANLVAIAALFELQHLPLKRGDRAVVPALAWPTLYAPLIQYGLNLVVADCDETWNMSPHIMYPVSDCALFVACSILGNPADLQTLAARAKHSGAIFIEDNCESFGARRHGKLCGTFGRMGTVSFYHSHQLSAIEGGAILTDDDECNELCRMLRNHGWTKGVCADDGFAAEYDFRLMGYNVRPLELHAAIAAEQLKKVTAHGHARSVNYLCFIDRVTDAKLPIDLPQITHGATLNPFGFAFTVKTPEKREKLAAAFRAAGIDCRPPVGGSLRMHPYGKPWAKQETPRADYIHTHGLFLGNAPFDITDKIDAAVKIMGDVL